MCDSIILHVECIVCNKSLQKINHNPKRVLEKMGKITNRRSRTPNWSVDEKQYLLELIKERKDVVVTKTTNGPNLYEEKDVAWNEILRELTVRFGNKFHNSTTKKVKTQWQNMKRIAREEITLNGPLVHKYSKQSYDVCSILELIKDGVLLVSPSIESDNTANESALAPSIENIEIKTERIDDENIPLAQAYELSARNNMETDQPQEPSVQAMYAMNVSESSSVSEQLSDANDYEGEIPPPYSQPRRNFSTNTEESSFVETTANPLLNDLQQFHSYTNEVKQLKLQTLKEERLVMKAMRETAELNKIIAEQRLKHVLWMKKQEMGMYSGEPGSGAGKGGGGGGAIREAGGTFGKMEAAREDEYFYRKQKEQLENLKGHLSKEISFHQEQIKRHEDAIRRHKEQMADVDSKK